MTEKAMMSEQICNAKLSARETTLKCHSGFHKLRAKACLSGMEKMQEAFACKDFHTYFEIAVILHSVSSSKWVEITKVISNLGRLGLREELREFSIAAIAEDVSFDSLSLAYLDLNDLANAVFWLEKALSKDLKGRSSSV